MRNARNRKRRPGRRRPFLDPKPTILIVCEGEKTEPQYLEGFSRACRNPRVRIKLAHEHGVPMTLVRTAKQYKKEAEQDAAREKDDNLAYDFVWCVFDVDEHSEVANVKEMSRDNDIDLAISNPCFELWLLLHFRDNPGMQHRSRLRRMLADHVPDYRKHIEYSAYSDGYPQAVARAREMDRSASDVNEPGRNPTTGVYNLTELIRTK